MTSLHGARPLARLVVRRDRVRLTVWVLGLVLMVIATVGSLKGLYHSTADLRSAAVAASHSTAAIALQGPARGLENLGGRTVFELGAFAFVAVALMNLFLVGRHTRTEEESGRAELVRAAAVGRHAALGATLGVALAIDVAFAVLNALGLVAEGMAVTGSIAYSASLAAVGFCFAAVTAVAVQITEHNRTASAIAAAVLAVAYVLRAAGDVGSGALSWLSPIGWGQAVRAYDHERWWALALPLALAAVLVAAAVALASRRDVGAGMWAARAGHPRASNALLRPGGLAGRLHRGALIGWAIGLFLGGVTYGSVGKDVGDIVGNNHNLRDVFTQGRTGGLTDLYFATILGMLALIAAGFTLQAVVQLRNEETAGRAELVLATAVSRVRWAASHAAVALVGSAVVVVAAGFGAGLTYGLMVGDLGQVGRLTGAAAAQIPALWVLLAVALLLVGWAPRALNAVWGLLAACVVVGVFGELLGLPMWLRDLSPFQHAGQVPAAAVPVAALAILCAIALVLGAAAMAGLLRRDVI